MRNLSFFAGPTKLPDEVLRQIKDEMLDFQGTGLSILEIGHRDEIFLALHHETLALIRELLAVPEDFAIILNSSGASDQFFALPSNLLHKNGALYLVSGEFSMRASTQAQNLYQNITELTIHEDFRKISLPSLDKEYDFVYLCQNETANGLYFQDLPQTSSPIVNDATSLLFGRPIDVSKYGAIFAGSQKQLGITGLTLIIIKKSLINQHAHTPDNFNLRHQLDKDSMPHTINTFSVYVMNLMLKYYKKLGLEKIFTQNRAKASELYDLIDHSTLYKNRIHPQNRSIQNIIVDIEPRYLAKFVEKSRTAGLYGLKGHWNYQNIRINTYNASTLEDIHRLMEFMRDFEKDDGK